MPHYRTTASGKRRGRSRTAFGYTRTGSMFRSYWGGLGVNGKPIGAGSCPAASGPTRSGTSRRCSRPRPPSSSPPGSTRRSARSRPRRGSGSGRSTATSRPGPISSWPSSGIRSRPAPRLSRAAGQRRLAVRRRCVSGSTSSLTSSSPVWARPRAAIGRDGFEALHTYFLDRLVPVCGQLLDAAVDAGEARPGMSGYELMRGIGSLCARRDTIPATTPVG